MDETKNPWVTLKSEQVYESAWIGVTRHEVINPAGNPAVYSTVHFKNLAIGIIPVDGEGNTWLVGQYRYPISEYSWEIIEGGGKHGVDPVESAKRELKEEAGITAGHYREILRMHLSNSVSDELAIIYVATGLSFGDAEPEESEQLQVKKVSLDEAYRLVDEGKITDSLSVAGILRLRLMMQEGKL